MFGATSDLLAQDVKTIETATPFPVDLSILELVQIVQESKTLLPRDKCQFILLYNVLSVLYTSSNR